MKKLLKISGWTLLATFVLFLLFAVLLYVPPIQRWTVDKATTIASEKTGMDISISQLRLSFPFDLSVEGVEIMASADSLSASKDTIANIRKTIVDVRLLPLLIGNLVVDELQIQSVNVNTSNLIEAVCVKGGVRELSLRGSDINLFKEKISLDDIYLDGAKLDIQMFPTEETDTTETETKWKIGLGKLAMNESDVRLVMPGDSLLVTMEHASGVVNGGYFDLFKGLYEVDKADVDFNKISYDNLFEPVTEGLDYNHLSFTDISLAADSIRFCAPELHVRMRKGDFKEKSGLQLVRLNGLVKMDSTSLYMSSVNVGTSNSQLSVNGKMDISVLDSINPGTFNLKADAEIGKGDLVLFMSGMPQSFKSSWPQYPLAIDVDVNGNLRQLNIDGFNLELPTAFRVNAEGFAANMDKKDDFVADIALDARSYNLNFLTHSVLGKEFRKSFTIPNGIVLEGKVTADKGVCKVNVNASQGKGGISFDADCNLNRMTYEAHLEINEFPVHEFLPLMDITPLTAKLDVSGSGLDIWSPKTTMQANMELASCTVDGYNLGGTTAKASIDKGVVYSNLVSVNDLLKGSISLDALLKKKSVNATLACELDNIDLYGLKMSKVPLSTSLCTHIDFATDMNEFYKLEGFVSDVVIQDSARYYRARDLELDLFTRVDTTWAKLQSGDFHLDLAASGGYKSLLSLGGNLKEELKKQVDRKYISQDSLKQILPVGHLKLHSGKNNFASGYLRRMGYDYREVNVDVASSPATGINGYAQLDSLYAYDMQIDKIRLELSTDQSVFKYHGVISNDKYNPQATFRADFGGSLFETGSNLDFSLFDDKDKVGLKLGLRAMLEQEGIRVKLSDTNAILGYRKFKANDDNFVFMANNNRLSANMKLLAEDGTGLQLFSNDDNHDALQDITLGIHKLDLASIIKIIPFFPDVKGILNGDFHALMTHEEMSVSSTLGIDGLVHEGNPIGDIATDFVYMPQENGGHYVDGLLMLDDNTIGTVQGTYSTVDSIAGLNANVTLERLPLSVANGFVPDKVIALRGFGDGNLKIKGPLSDMQIDGEMDLDSAYLASVPYGVELRFDNRPVKIKDSKLLFENFNMYSSNNQSLAINGDINFKDPANMTIGMRMTARNFLIIDSKENRRSEVFGKMYVNFDGRMTGLLAEMQVRGNLNVLGSTNLTYILRDSPLTTDNKMDELVKFTDFTSTRQETIVRPPIGGLYMDLYVNIDQGARILCALNATKSNYLDMIGGGTLRMTYRGDDLRLTGRYTLNSGEMKYSLPVIPLKTFNIKEGSYVEFAGDIMNPKLNITATENIKTNVNMDGTSQPVMFNCGVEITQTLNNMGLGFIIEAPENMTLNGELMSKSKEERGKLAVTMLTTGMYLSENNLSSFSMNDALSSFLQSEISNISGSALRTLDLSVGLDNTTDASGATHTDYTFKFAKRFWNNRMRVVVGGKVASTQANAENMFDNVAVEYRLDQSANTNLRLFYDRATYDFLEGYVGQYGVGIVWKRKLQSLRDLFKPSKGSVYTQTMKTDSVSVDSIKVVKGGKE